MEANTAALQVTPHKCDAPDAAGHYAKCDGGGCALNTRSLGAGAYGPGPAFAVDTTRPFTVATSFVNSSAGVLSSVVTRITQPGSAGANMTHTDASCSSPGYLDALSSALADGMVPILSLWGGAASDMAWLDIPPCTASQDCDPSSVMTVSAISLAGL
jgi:cellulase